MFEGNVFQSLWVMTEKALYHPCEKREIEGQVDEKGPKIKEVVIATTW